MTDLQNGPVGAIEGLSARGLLVGSYSRRMPVSLERMYENALDWEHLPHLHRGAFSSIELIESGHWGWRAKVGLDPKGTINGDNFIVLQLHLDRKRHRWISSTLEGPGAGSEIWTHVFKLDGGDIEVLVDFFIPTNSAAERTKLGSYYQRLYTGLYDEDEAMMVERQRQLDGRSGPVEGEGEWVLGLVAALKAQVPLRFKHQNREFRLIKLAGEWIAHATQCPHRLGPLGETEVLAGVVECPWHGYKFDIRSGQCLTGQSCQLPPAPTLRENERGELIVCD